MSTVIRFDSHARLPRSHPRPDAECFQLPERSRGPAADPPTPPGQPPPDFRHHGLAWLFCSAPETEPHGVCSFVSEPED